MPSSTPARLRMPTATLRIAFPEPTSRRAIMSRLLLCTTLGLAAGMACHAQQPSSANATPILRVATPLLDNDGVPVASPPWAVPVRADHRTRAGLYATEAQARALEQTSPGKVISVLAKCCGEPGLGEAMLSAWDQYVRFDAPSDMPVLVRGSDLPQAARLADRLTEAGFAPVFLVSVP